MRAACAGLVSALRAGAPVLCVLATSREPLGVDEEYIWPVPPLSLLGLVTDASPETVTASGVGSSEAVQLFVARATAAYAAFALTDANAPDVATICRRLDGMPLAIELAAARTSMLGVDQIAARLDDCFALLAGGDAAVPRHRTLHAAIEWSYDLLDEQEQTLFCRLGVFAGGCTLDAVEAVAPAAELAGAYALDVLTRLVEKSLVRVERHTGGAPRYTLLEVLRTFARERLVASGLLAAAARAHADVYRGLAFQAEAELVGPDQSAWISRLDSERPNLLAALACLRDGDEAEPFLSMAASLWRFWYLRGYLSEGRRWLETALARAEPAPPAIRAKALNAVGWLAKEQHDFGAAQAALAEAAELWRSVGDLPGLATACSNLGSLAYEQAALDTARHWYEQSLAIFRELSDRRNIATLLNNVGQSMPIGEQAMAVPLYEESLALCRADGNGLVLVPPLNNLGLAAYVLHDFSAARRYYHEALAICRGLGYRYGEALVLANLGHVALAEAQYELAASCQVQSLTAMHAIGHQGGVVHAYRSLAASYLAIGRVEDAAWHAAAAEVAAGNERIPVPPAYADEAAATTASLAQLLQPDDLARIRGAVEALSPDALQSTAEQLAREVASAGSSEGSSLPVAAKEAMRPASRLAGLSPRQQDVLRLLVAGRSNREIAEELVLSIRTVEHHVAGIYGRLGAHNRTEAATMALNDLPQLAMRRARDKPLAITHHK